MYHCCRIWSTLDTVQYRTSPDARPKNIQVKKNGMISIIFACRGSPPTGVIRCCTNIVTPIRSGRMYVGSCAARSQIQSGAAPRPGNQEGRCPKQRNGAP